jgi:hypothetical protein
VGGYTEALLSALPAWRCCCHRAGCDALTALQS